MDMGSRTAERCVNQSNMVVSMCGCLSVLKPPLATTLTGRAAGSHAKGSMRAVSCPHRQAVELCCPGGCGTFRKARLVGRFACIRRIGVCISNLNNVAAGDTGSRPALAVLTVELRCMC
jgi:hypothetical protein